MYFQILFAVLSLQVAVRALDDALLRQLAGVSEALEGDLNVLQQQDTRDSKRCNIVIDKSGSFKGFKCHTISTKTSDLNAESSNSAQKDKDASQIRKKRQAQGVYYVQPLQKYMADAGYNGNQVPQTMPKTRVTVQNYPLDPWYPRRDQGRYPRPIPEQRQTIQTHPAPWYQTMPKQTETIQTYPLLWTNPPRGGGYPGTPKQPEITQTYRIPQNYYPYGAIPAPKTYEFIDRNPPPWPPQVYPKYEQTMFNPNDITQKYPEGQWSARNLQVNAQLPPRIVYDQQPSFVRTKEVQTFQSKPMLLRRLETTGNVDPGRRELKSRSGDLENLVGNNKTNKEAPNIESPTITEESQNAPDNLVKTSELKEESLDDGKKVSDLGTGNQKDPNGAEAPGLLGNPNLPSEKSKIDESNAEKTNEANPKGKVETPPNTRTEEELENVLTWQAETERK